MVQETFLAAGRDIAQFRGGGPDELRGWLKGILQTPAGQHSPPLPWDEQAAGRPRNPVTGVVGVGLRDIRGRSSPRR